MRRCPWGFSAENPLRSAYLPEPCRVRSGVLPKSVFGRTSYASPCARAESRDSRSSSFQLVPPARPSSRTPCSLGDFRLRFESSEKERNCREMGLYQLRKVGLTEVDPFRTTATPGPAVNAVPNPAAPVPTIPQLQVNPNPTIPVHQQNPQGLCSR